MKLFEELLNSIILSKFGLRLLNQKNLLEGKNPNDEAVSDVYKLKDKGKRKLALRYEFTFQLKRIVKGKKLPYKRFQIGPVFRDEPVTGNRLRQFTQCDIDIVGSNAKSEAEVLAMIKEILDKLKIKSITYVNNRKLLNEILDEQGIKKKEEVKWAALNVAGISNDEARQYKQIYHECVFLDRTKGEVHMQEVIEMILDGFQQVIDAGTLSREPCMKMKVSLMDIKLHEDSYS